MLECCDLRKHHGWLSMVLVHAPACTAELMMYEAPIMYKMQNACISSALCFRRQEGDSQVSCQAKQ